MTKIAQPFMIKFFDKDGKIKHGKAIECDASGDVFKVLRTGGIDKGATETIDSCQIVAA